MVDGNYEFCDVPIDLSNFLISLLLMAGIVLSYLPQVSSLRAPS